MAVKPIIDIDIDDSAFQRFLDLYNTYKESLEELPHRWQQVGEEINKSAGATGTMTAETRAAVSGLAAMASVARTMAGAFDDAGKSQRNFSDGTRSVIGGLERIVGLASAATGGMRGLGFALRQTGRSGILGGSNLLSQGNAGMGLLGGVAMTAGLLALASGAVLLGATKFTEKMDNLGYAAVGRWREARGVGMTPGETEAFRTYLNPYIEADQTASAVANARNDVTQRWRFATAGVTQNELANKSNFELSQEVVRNIHARLKAMPEATWLNQAHTLGFDAFMSDESMRRLRTVPTGDVSEALKKAAEARADLGFSDKTAKAWIELTTTLHKARMEIETGFIIGLQKATPMLEDMAKKAGKFLHDFLSSKEFEERIGKIADEIKDAFGFVTSERFKSALRGMFDLIEGMIHLGQSVGLLSKPPEAVPAPPGTPPTEILPAPEEAQKETNPMRHGWWHNLTHPMLTLGQHWDFSEPEKRYQLPSGVLSALAEVESGFRSDAVSPAGARGMFQIMPGTQDFIRENLDKTHRVVDPFDPAEQSYQAGLFMSYLLKKYNGDEEKALAAYNWGDANVDAAAKKWGKDWQAHTPSEVMDYVHKVEKAQQGYAKSQSQPVAPQSAAPPTSSPPLPPVAPQPVAPKLGAPPVAPSPVAPPVAPLPVAPPVAPSPTKSSDIPAIHPTVARTLDGIRKAQLRRQQIVVTVNNGTGSNLAVQANGASYG